MGSKRNSRSRAWVQRQAKDPYVQQARARAFRSRAAFKLEQLDKKERLLRPGMTVIDLGAAPGSWSQYAVTQIGSNGRVIALDRLEFPPIDDVTSLIGDFLDSHTVSRLKEILGQNPADLVISDMAPNLTGVKSIDQSAMGELVIEAARFARQHLSPRGAFVAKFFEGSEAKTVKDEVASLFRNLRIRKPDASRSESAEVYLVARDVVS